MLFFRKNKPRQTPLYMADYRVEFNDPSSGEPTYITAKEGKPVLWPAPADGKKYRILLEEVLEGEENVKS